jgi:hypothetical protein
MLTLRRKRLIWAYLSALLLESITVGWLLSDYKAHWLTWVGTQAVTLHLAWTGMDAIVVAIGWLVGIVWAGAIAYSWPATIQGLGVVIWINGVGMMLWAGALASGWILGVILALTLASAKKAMESIDWSKAQVFLILVLITWSGFSIGRTINSLVDLVPIIHSSFL